MTKERGGSLIFLAAGIYGLVFSIQLPFGRWNEPGPAVFPLALSILLCILGIAWFTKGKSENKRQERSDWGKSFGKLRTPIKIVGLTLAYILTFDRAGYFLATLVYVFILFLWVSRYKLWIAAGLSMVIGAGSWFFFQRLLAVQLPKGFMPL